MSLDWAELGQAFDELAGMPPASRAERLIEWRLRDAHFAEELTQLLAAHDAAEGFFEEKIPRIFASLAPDLSLAPGERVLHFEIVELLGEGSSAMVYLARDTELGRQVALKVTLNQSQEARTLAHFNLDGIVQVYSEHVVQREGLPLRLICLQFVAGQTLGRMMEALRGGGEFLRSHHAIALEPAALKWRELLHSGSKIQAMVLLGMRLAEILSLAHDRGILHLDIKPANILIDAFGRPFLSDFNVSTQTSRLAAGDARGLGGTPHFMAPEQARLFESGGVPDLDGRADVFALGVVLRDLLNIVGSAPKLSEIIGRATAPDRNARTECARTLARELGEWLRSHQTEKEMPALFRGFGWICERPLLAMSAVTVMSQLMASVINITYNQVEIVSKLSPQQNEVFMSCVAAYNLVTYPLLLACVGYALRALFIRSADRAWARRTSLRVAPVLAIAISVGWLPGAWLFPRMIEHFAGPLPSEIYWQFAGSFTLAWLLSLTTTLSLVLFVLARALYPRHWLGQSGVAAAELRPSERLNRILSFAAALVPLIGVLMVVLMAPKERILILVTVGLGLLNLFLVQRVTGLSEVSFSALKRSRTFD